MAIRARLTPPREPRTEWPWHQVQSASLSASHLCRGARRMEADSYLSSGFGTRIAIESKPSGWIPLGNAARVWQPPRLKGIQVDRAFGTPYLTATQVFDLRPVPRKWLSLEKTLNVAQLVVRQGSILVTRSGTVGRTTLARSSLKRFLISDDLLRVEPRDDSYWGWLYAYLRAPTVISLMQATHYGNVIKHLEVEHLTEVPVVQIGADARQSFAKRLQSIFDCRNRAEELLVEAETLLSSAFSLPETAQEDEIYSTATYTELASQRRRLEGSFHTNSVRELLRRLHVYSVRVDLLGNISERIWWMSRFKRNFGANGVHYMSADDLFSISQISQKRVYTDPIPHYRTFFVEEGWLLMACSGQVYGLNGGVILATKHDEDCFFSHDLIRITPRKESVRPGYLVAYLGHPNLGKILAKRTAYGSSVPHIDPQDVERIPIGRLTKTEEGDIAELAEEASRLNAKAANEERELSREADEIVRDFVR